MNNCEYLTWIKRQRKKQWGKKAERPRWRQMNKLYRQRRAREFDKRVAAAFAEVFGEKRAEILAKIKRTLNKGR